jgi:hypothetical protein
VSNLLASLRRKTHRGCIKFSGHCTRGRDARHLVTLLAGVLFSGLAGRVYAEQPVQSTEYSIKHGPVVGGGLVQANAVGPSVLGGWKLEFPLASWAYVSAGPTVAYLSNSKTHSLWLGPDAVESPNTDTQRILALSLDPFLGIRLAGPLSLEVGANAGVASNAAKSTYCGKETYLAGFVGLEGGFAIRAGSKSQYQASVHAVAVTLPALRCSYYDGRLQMYHERDFETTGALLRLGLTL